MVTEETYTRLLADMINRDADARQRERRVREANRELYRVVVDPKGTNTQADLALVEAARVGR